MPPQYRRLWYGMLDIHGNTSQDLLLPSRKTLHSRVVAALFVLLVAILPEGHKTTVLLHPPEKGCLITGLLITGLDWTGLDWTGILKFVFTHCGSDSGSSNILKERVHSLDWLQLWTTNLDRYVSQWVLFTQKPLSCELIRHMPSTFVFLFNWNLYGKIWKWA